MLGEAVQGKALHGRECEHKHVSDRVYVSPMDYKISGWACLDRAVGELISPGRKTTEVSSAKCLSS